MPPRQRLILDSNAYFRLALSIHPLLEHSFGPYQLAVIQELDEEFDRSPRLQNKFDWVAGKEHIADREKRVIKPGKNRVEIDRAYSYFRNAPELTRNNTSQVDIRVLAVCHVLGHIAVTDDQGMIAAAALFDVPVKTTLELLDLMLKNNRSPVSQAKIREIAEYWRYTSDLPANYQADFIRLFGPPVP